MKIFNTQSADHLIAMSSSLKDASVALVNARQSRTPLPEFPGSLPTTLAEAYQLQDYSLKAWQDDVTGWKVGGISPAIQMKYGEEWLVGPIFRKNTKHVDGHRLDMPVFAGGFAAVEAEFILEIGDVSDMSGVPTSAQEVLPYIRACRIGAEIASSPMRAINEIGPMAVISDFGNNHGLILGPSLNIWSPAMLAEIEVKTYVDRECVGTARAKAPPGGPLSAAAYLIRNLKERGLPIPVGLQISTGALTGIHDVEPGQTSRVEFAGIGAFEIAISAL